MEFAEDLCAIEAIIDEQNDRIDDIESGNVNSTLDYIRVNGLYVSENWRLGEEAEFDDDLILRDVTSTMEGIDSYYRFR